MPVQDGPIHVEKINGPFLFRKKGTPAEYKAGLNLAIARRVPTCSGDSPFDAVAYL